MADERPGDEVAPDEPAGPCRSCGAPTSSAQRYCLSCGELVGARRLDPLLVLQHQGGEVPAAAPAPAPAPATRAAPMAAAVAAIAVAGLAGSLVAGGGDRARAAVITRPAVAAVPTPAPAPTTTAAKPSTPAPAPAPTDTTAADDTSTTADAAPVDDTAVPAATDPGTDTSTDTGADTGDDTTTPDDSKIPPHVWLLAIEGPRAQEAVDRVAEQGVRLTGVRPLTADTIGNATTLVTGTAPAGAAAAGTATTTDPAAAPTPSLPEELTTAGQTWRSYVDLQPGGADALPGACTDPPAGDAAAATLAGRTPFGRITALRTDDLCAKGTASLETLGNDVSSGDTLPSFSYATLGGCAPPDRTVVALPDQVSDTVTAITESTEYQENGVVIVTTVGATDPCPATPPAAPAPAVDPAAALPPAPTVVLRADAKAGSSLDVATDLRSLTRLAATTLGVDPPGTSGADDVPALDLPAAGG